MNTYKLISLLALLILILVVPAYAWLEPTRMDQAQANLRQEFVSDAAVIYVENCAVCPYSDVPPVSQADSMISRKSAGVAPG